MRQKIWIVTKDNEFESAWSDQKMAQTHITQVNTDFLSEYHIYAQIMYSSQKEWFDDQRKLLQKSALSKLSDDERLALGF